MTQTKKVMISLTIVILFFSFGIYISSFFLSNKEGTNEITNTSLKEESSQREKNTILNSDTVHKNKYYIVYIKQDDGKASSFVPKKLNPSFKEDADYNVSISIDDNGNILNDGKIIVVDNFVISKENKKTIKKIAGEENYKGALKEIEERVINAKKSMENPIYSN
ncbi:hypothetical protein MXL46_17005 [Heyndrickxia sporothermodurans]|uniref:Uncharacterized protein n=1 Tax=Heyndrickxia sporothermodurans TaxID=46224 RepID=A0A150KQ63_9BACI|nr:hypothetical protein [Heyndrickxia sporothermodurans]KYC98270.1 hypothetical protein B4102_3500 [Heyndrickxia sporothermodurans]MBL5773017.1 hypothetical protein [Heyndrickxia sporothermodurans]MBL5780009.1 hypothetical protein [Heyndrickxia sporothermodurans]MBL5787126.1 hypothetical protein [Heyndrickxia sporothermodurans]MBL5790699.1 hypothetical protein [Heyndrickxia sporothermodurans]